MSTGFSYGSGRTVLVPVVMAALLLGVTVAGCGAATSSATSGNPPASTAAPDSGPQGAASTAGGSQVGSSQVGSSQAAAPPSSIPPEADPSSPPPQADPGFPAEPDGVTFSGGVAGGVDAFSVPAGGYVENTQASYDPANDASGSGECLFSGEFDYLSGAGWSAPLGGAGPLTDMSPINGPAVKITLAAGDYKIYIYPETTCDWTIELVPQGA